MDHMQEADYLSRGMSLLDRIQSRLSSCNCDAGLNFIDTDPLRYAYKLIDQCRQALALERMGVRQDAAFNTDRHTAIRCTHATDAIRERMSKAFEQSSLFPLLSLRYPEPSSLADLLHFMTTVATAECSSIMIEHAEEIATEYKTILRNERRNGR